MNVAEFRSGLREWLDQHDLSPRPDQSFAGEIAQLARVRRALYDAGWMRYGWPAEVGGLGDQSGQQRHVTEVEQFGVGGHRGRRDFRDAVVVDQ